jgi:hypothetical protein
MGVGVQIGVHFFLQRPHETVFAIGGGDRIY